MLQGADKFTILLCGKKEVMERVRRYIPLSQDIHLQFSSSPGFLAGRALFHSPRLVLLDAAREYLSCPPVLNEFTARHPDTAIVALAEKPDSNIAAAMRQTGAMGYFVFPDEHRKVSEQIRLLYEAWSSEGRKREFVQYQQEAYDFRNIAGASPLLHATLSRAKKIIRNSAVTVLITGETGTGKELLARAIHYNGRTRSNPFVDIACSALPESLLESELFGHERGAFTDARERKMGLFELAGEGTIFLDEIGDISPAMQSKLLKVIEDRTMRRVGGITDIPVKARIIAATSVDLEAKMRSGEFRRDLYHRLKILPLELPPLRRRKEDIPILASEFLRKFNALYNKRIRGITSGGLALLMEHRWEGNVRELKHCIERATLLEDGEWITEEDFDLGTHELRLVPTGAAAVQGQAGAGPEGKSLMLLVPLQRASVGEVQRMLVDKVLAQVDGNKAKAARLLKISRPRLDRILKKAKGDEG